MRRRVGSVRIVGPLLKDVSPLVGSGEYPGASGATRRSASSSAVGVRSSVSEDIAESGVAGRFGSHEMQIRSTKYVLMGYLMSENL